MNQIRGKKADLKNEADAKAVVDDLKGAEYVVESVKKKETQKLMDQVLASMAPPPAPPQAPTPVVPTQRKRRDLWAEVERLKKK